MEVILTDDPARVRKDARQFLAAKPVMHNLILSLLEARIQQPEPGRYWMAQHENAIVGVALQSPLHFAANLTPMPPPVIASMVDAIAAAGIELPGAYGNAATAASFAGQWTERTKSAASPEQGQRIYEVAEVNEGPGVPGSLRRAEAADRRLILQWTQSFAAETASPSGDPERMVNRWLAAQWVWLWRDTGDNAQPVSMAVAREPVEAVVRVQGVYTSPEKRGRGYAQALVTAVSKQILAARNRAILFTDLANPVSNSIYRRIGYRAVAETLRYRFAPASRS